MTNQQDSVSILGIAFSDLSQQQAVDHIEGIIRQPFRTTHGIYIANAHTLNLAAEDAHYHTVLRDAHRVFGDGTGVRWAARLRGVRLKDNLVGTDLVPQLFSQTAGRSYRYFLLGADAKTIAAAARHCRKSFPGWHLAGFHSGYFEPQQTTEVVRKINASRPHLLLVGMGNPRQEIWIHQHREALQVPVCIGVGGLFDHWGGNLKRAPQWVRQRGFEWFQLMLQQPHKWRRYLLGNPKYLMRILVSTPAERQRARPVTWSGR